MITHNIPFIIIKKKITLHYSKSAAMGFFQGTQEQVQNSRGKRAISVRATEVLLYFVVSDVYIHTSCCLDCCLPVRNTSKMKS